MAAPQLSYAVAPHEQVRVIVNDDNCVRADHGTNNKNKTNRQCVLLFFLPSSFVTATRNSNNSTDVLDEVHCTVLVICVTCIQMTIGSSHDTVLPVPGIVHEFDFDPAATVDQRRFHVAVTQLFMCSIGGKRTCSMEHCHDYDSCNVDIALFDSRFLPWTHSFYPCFSRV